MHNTEIVYNLINEKDLVLDVGSASQPFLRADHVIDIVPYEKAQFANITFKCKQRFSEKTWHQQDVCDYKKPWPWADKTFDFSVAGHIFEDVRDPIYAISEMIRVSKKGYIEVPSRYFEQMIGIEFDGVCGFAHHRWIIDTEDNKIMILFKSHELHSTKRTNWQVAKSGDWPHMNRNIANLGIFWEGNVECFEKIDIDLSFSRKYFEETVANSKKLANFYDVKQPPKQIIDSPFKNDNKPHIVKYINNEFVKQ